MYENKNKQNTGTKTIKKIGKVTYEVIVLSQNICHKVDLK